jgi:hypothetical protein
LNSHRAAMPVGENPIVVVTCQRRDEGATWYQSCKLNFDRGCWQCCPQRSKRPV